MNTYTIRALTVTDAALVKIAAGKLAAYDTREGMSGADALDGTWDMIQGATLAEHLRSALEIIERLTRPAAAPEPVTYRGTHYCDIDGNLHAKSGTGTGWPA